MRRALSALSLFVVVGALGALSQSPAGAAPSDNEPPVANGVWLGNPILYAGDRWVKYDAELDVTDYGGSGIKYYLSNEKYAGFDGRFGSWGSQRASYDNRQNEWLRAGHRVCVRDRAVDNAGNGGAWLGTGSFPLPLACTTAPFDDSVATKHGSVRKVVSGSAWGGSASMIDGSGSLSVPVPAGAIGLEVRMRAQTGHGGEAPGAVDVWNNGRKIDSLDTYVQDGAYVVFPGYMAGRLRPGTLTLRNRPYTPGVVVDAVQLYGDHDRTIE